MKKILTVLLVFTVSESIACKCSPEHELNYYLRSDFVAIAKITDGFKDTLEVLDYNIPEYWIKIHPIEVFKGKSPDSLKVSGVGMCILTMKEKSTWLIYGKKSQDRGFQINYCSGSEQLDKYEHYSQPFSEERKADHRLSIEKKIRQLEVIKKHGIEYTYPLLDIFAENLDDKLMAFEGILLKDDFAIFEVELTPDMKVEKVEVVDGFNAKIDQKLEKIIARLSFKSYGDHPPEARTKWLIGIYYYPAEKDNPSFLSQWLL